MLKRLVVAAAAVALWALPCAAASPELLPGKLLQAGGVPIDDHKLGHFVPTVVDWDGDGKKDLIIGSFTGEPGNVRLYRNIGTDADPKFDKPVFLEAGGKPIRLSGG